MDHSKHALKSLPDHIKQTHINCLAIIPEHSANNQSEKENATSGDEDHINIAVSLKSLSKLETIKHIPHRIR